MLTKYILIAAICVLAGGCVPETFHYYAPSAPVGELEATHGNCNDVKDRIVFRDPDNSDVSVSLQVRGVDRPGAPLDLTIAVVKKHYSLGYDFSKSAEQRAKEEADVKALWGRPITVRLADSRIAVVSASGERSLYPLEFPNGLTNPLTLGETSYWLRLKFSKPMGDFFLLEIPEIAFNGTKLVIPPIRYTPTIVHTMAGINC